MVGKQILYHGSEINRAKSILENKKYIASEDDKHWLGDGIYFYVDKILAYRWIWNMHLDRHGEVESHEELFNKYGILNSEVNFIDNRVYNLKEIEFQEDFRKIKQIVITKAEKDSQVVKKIIDGTVLNLMFNNFGYDKDYDIVIALFANKKKNLVDLMKKSKIWYGHEEQVCVKNPSCVVITSIHKAEDFEKTYELIQDTYKVKYNINRKSMYTQ